MVFLGMWLCLWANAPAFYISDLHLLLMLPALPFGVLPAASSVQLCLNLSFFFFLHLRSYRIQSPKMPHVCSSAFALFPFSLPPHSTTYRATWPRTALQGPPWFYQLSDCWRVLVVVVPVRLEGSTMLIQLSVCCVLVLVVPVWLLGPVRLSLLSVCWLCVRRRRACDTFVN